MYCLVYIRRVSKYLDHTTNKPALCYVLYCCNCKIIIFLQENLWKIWYGQERRDRLRRICQTRWVFTNLINLGQSCAAPFLLFFPNENLVLWSLQNPPSLFCCIAMTTATESKEAWMWYALNGCTLRTLVLHSSYSTPLISMSYYMKSAGSGSGRIRNYLQEPGPDRDPW